TFSASGGAGGYTFSASGLPSGVSLNSGGTLSGAPTVAGNFVATITVTDSAGSKGSTSFTFNVLGLVLSALPNGIAGQFYSASVSAAGGSQPYSFLGSGVPAG